MPQQVRAEETRARILTAAHHCFSRMGYNAASVSDICNEAGVTKGAFYYHFSTKHDLFMDLLDTWLLGVDASLANARKENHPVPAVLLEMADSTQFIFSETSGYLPMFLEFWQQSLRDPTIWQASIQPYRRYVDFFADILNEGIAEGSLKPIDPQETARTLVALSIGVILQGMMDPQGTDWSRVMRGSIQTLLRGIQSSQ